MTQGIVFNRTVIVGVLLSAAFLTILNQTLLINALPPIMSELDIDASRAQWLTTAFMLTNGVLIPVSAFLIEKFSSRKLLLTALLVFLAGTVIGAVAPNFSVLLVARVVQAGGAGIMMPLMQTVMMTIYPPEKRGSAMGMAGLVIAFAPAIGPTLSGWVLDHFTWRYLFYIVIPIGLVVVLVAYKLMQNVTVQREAKVDTLSIILSSIGWGGLLYGFSMAGSLGWLDPTVIWTLVVAAVSLTIFIRRQLGMERPLLEFRVFRSRAFVVTTTLSVLVFAVMIGSQTLLPIYAQNLRSFSALESGLIMLPGAIVQGVLSPFIGRIFDRIGGKGLSICGFSLIVLSMVLYLNIQLDTSLPFLALVFTIMMIGISMNMMPLMTAGINALPPAQIPHGTAMMNTIRMVGASTGTALLVSLMSGVVARKADSAETVAQLDGIITAFAAAGGLALVGLLMSIFLLKHKKPARQSSAAPMSELKPASK